MSKKKIITIIIPTFNSANYLTKTLECLKNQTAKNFKVIIIDDNSIDITEQISKKYSFVSYLNKSKKLRRGAAASLNYILKKVETPFVALIDSDAYLNQNWTKVVAELLEKEKIVGAPILAEDKNGLIAYLAGLEIESRYEYLPTYVSHLSTCNLAFGITLMKDFNFDENLFYAYDHQLSFYLKRNDIKFYLTKKTFCYHGNKNSLKNYLVQQYQIVKNHTLLSKKMSHEAAQGDEISPNFLAFQPPLTLLMITAFFLNPYWALVFFILILLLNSKFLIYLNKKSKSFLLLPAVGLVVLRNLVWTAAFIVGLTK